jgi:hypothetical protein
MRIPEIARLARTLLEEVSTRRRMPPERDAEERELGTLVLGYLEEHPQAMETLEGIAQWWIERQRIRVNVEALSRALEDLTERGKLEAVGTGPNRRYRRTGRSSVGD